MSHLLPTLRPTAVAGSGSHRHQRHRALRDKCLGHGHKDKETGSARARQDAVAVWAPRRREEGLSEDAL